MKTNRAKVLSTTALIAVLCMQLFWMWNSFQMTVHQMGYETPWNLAPDVRAQALLAAFYESKFTVLTSLLTTVVIILSLIDQINYIDEQDRLLTISKLEHGKLHIQKAEVNLETMIEDVVDKYKAKSAKPIHITTRFGAR